MYTLHADWRPHDAFPSCIALPFPAHLKNWQVIVSLALVHGLPWCCAQDKVTWVQRMVTFKLTNRWTGSFHTSRCASCFLVSEANVTVFSLVVLMQEYHHVIVDCPRQLHVLQNLMERGKLTEKECELEKRNFVDYVRERCNKRCDETSPLFRHCVIAGMAVILLLIMLFRLKSSCYGRPM